MPVGGLVAFVEDVVRALFNEFNPAKIAKGSAAEVAVATASFVTIEDLLATSIRGRLIGITIRKATSSANSRALDNIRVTIDSEGAETFQVNFQILQDSAARESAFIALGGRFKTGFKLEVNGTASSGTFLVSALWEEEV